MVDKKTGRKTRGKDLTGQQFNYLYVEEFAPNYAKESNIKDQHLFWKCKCICGKIGYYQSSALITGKIKSCGCKSNQIIDYSGKNLGWLIVLEQDRKYTEEHQKLYPNDRKVFWKCQCQCGNVCTRSSSYLRDSKCPKCPDCSKAKIDFIGQRNGMLVIKSFVGIKNGESIWRCQCDCGKEKDMSIELFRLVYSCGCLKTSIGEYNIKQILDKNKIDYIFNQSYFNDLVSAKGYSLRYDFIILNKDNKIERLVEFDGIQHFDKTVNYYSSTQEENDKIKNKYAKKHNYPLVRIPYWERDKITLEMIMGDKYLVDFSTILE